MLRLAFALILAVPATAELKVDSSAALMEAAREAELLRQDAKHWEMEKETLEELLDGRDSLSASSESKKRFLQQLEHAEKQQQMAEAALVQQTLEVSKLQASKSAGAADLTANPFWNPTQQGTRFEALEHPAAWGMPQFGPLHKYAPSAWGTYDHLDASSFDPESKDMKAAAKEVEKAQKNAGESMEYYKHQAEMGAQVWSTALKTGQFGMEGGPMFDIGMGFKKEKKGKDHWKHAHDAKDEPTTMPNGTCRLEMKDQLSGKYNRGDCIEGVTYGCMGDRNIWVNEGCRAKFKCNGDHEKCESFQYKFETCRCKDLKTSLLESKPKSYFNPQKILQDFTDAQVKEQAAKIRAWQDDQKDLTQKAKHASREQGRAQPKSLLEQEPDSEEPAEEVNQQAVTCKVQCQRFAMKNMGPEFEEIKTPQECVNKCAEVYGA